MKEQTGANYQASRYAKALCISEAKVGKTCALIGWALGVLPWCKSGGIVTKPEHLHVITFDANALGGVARFLRQTCGAPESALGYNVYNLQDDFRKVTESDNDYDTTFYNAVFNVISLIERKVASAGPNSVHCVVVSSLTGLAAGLERAVVGAPGQKKGYGSDPSKWKALAAQLQELQHYLQVDRWHCIWEAHLDKGSSFDMANKESAASQESIRVSGQAGRNWAFNVEQVFKIRRNFGTRHPNTQCDKVMLDTRPSASFLATGRGFTEELAPLEEDMAGAFKKLGLVTGEWKP